MTDPSNDIDRHIADDVLPPPVEELARPVQLDQLLPWHRPRKQFVREKQWLRFSKDLITKQIGKPTLSNHSGGKPEVRYLTLPGIDYIDVKLIADLCQEFGCSLTSIGFQAGEESNPDTATAQLRETSLIQAGYITRWSHTFPRRLEDIISRDGQAFRDLRRRGPFHIVNIDACGSLARPKATGDTRLIEALYRILELQFELMTGRWLLLITTDAQKESIAESTLTRLCNAIYSNAESNADFQQQAIPLLDPDTTDIRTAAEKARMEKGIPFLKLFSLGIAKWILELAHSKNWDMKTLRPYCYSTMPPPDKTPSMACLAFELLPPSPGLQDRFDVVRAKPAPVPTREDTSVRAVNQVSQMINADTEINSDNALRTRMTENLRKLLQQAGYSSGALEDLGT